MHDTRAKAWQRTAQKRDADRVKEMSGEWILAEPPWWTNFQRPCWQVAMRLRYGLEVNSAIGPNITPYCLARKMNGTYCLAHLDACGQHAQICKVEGANIHRHDTVRDGVIPEPKQHVTLVKKSNSSMSYRNLLRIPAPLLKHEWTSSLKCLSFELCWMYEFFFQRLPISGSRRERMKWKSTIGMLRIKMACVAPT